LQRWTIADVIDSVHLQAWSSAHALLVCWLSESCGLLCDETKPMHCHLILGKRIWYQYRFNTYIYTTPLLYAIIVLFILKYRRTITMYAQSWQMNYCQ
jgi:hypothetical protein